MSITTPETDLTPEPVSPVAAPDEELTPRKRPRAGTIVWGLMLLTAGIFGILGAVGAIVVTPMLVIIVSAGFGILLMVIAIVAAGVGSALRNTRDLAAADALAREQKAHQPVD